MTNSFSNQDNVKDNATEQLDQVPKRFVNTFMKRRTHMNQHAKIALSDPAFAVYLVNGQDGDISGIDNLRALFADSSNGEDAKLILEIGFGMGGSLIEMASANPQVNYVGIEVHEPGIGKCAYLAHEASLSNLKLINGDAVKLLQQLPENHLDGIQLYFPDPWQKKRHHKRRFVTPERMLIAKRVLKLGGLFHTATDWEHYAYAMLEVLDGIEGFENLAGAGNFMPRPDFRPLTKFEARGRNQGHGVWDLIYKKVG